jgi:hypothetical protein
MSILIYNGVTSLIEKDNKQLLSKQKPKFTFEYETIQFTEHTKSFVFADKVVELSEEQSIEVLDFIGGVSEDKETASQIASNLESLRYLTDTDWVNSKYTDEVVLLKNMTRVEFLAKYREVLEARVIARKNVVEIE